MQYKVLHTTGSFGNFISYLIDSHIAGQLLPDPFNASGSCDGRDTPTESLHGGESFYHLKDVIGKKDPMTKFIACVWDDEYFPYILHASYGRSNDGQYGGCGVQYLETNFFDFAKKHKSKDFFKDIDNLKMYFNIDVNESNPTIPRYILRQYFWLKFFDKEKHKFCHENKWLRSQPGLIQLNIEDVINYDRLVGFFGKLFEHTIDFKSLHNDFCEKNQSMKDFVNSKKILSAVTENRDIRADPISVIGEAFVFFELEKHYFDIPFFCRSNFFESTGEILDHVNYFPNVMKQPNKLFCKEYKRFSSTEHAI
jgi:hypothetical protein